MDERAWGTPRYVTLLVVLAVHLGLLALLWMGSRAFSLHSASMSQPLQVVIFPTSPRPKDRLLEVHPRRLSGDLAEWTAPVLLTAPSLPPVSDEVDGGAGGTGSGPDWAAEARRALQAYEIRNRQPGADSLISGSPAEDRWWRRGAHRPGDKYKTAAGDWIVWINSHCYQVATATGRTYTNGETPATVCNPESKD
jgi:hypothetical protein